MKINVIVFQDDTPILWEVVNRRMYTRNGNGFTVHYNGEKHLAKKIPPFRGYSVDITDAVD